MNVRLLNLPFSFIPLEGPLPDVIQEVSLPVITNKVCETMYREAGFVEDIPDIFICAGYGDGGKDSCEVNNIYS